MKITFRVLKIKGETIKLEIETDREKRVIAITQGIGYTTNVKGEE